ncbi:MAG TPA: gephyrin-like molybdotransferase Glp [Abditibacteriaceae bacterium]|jgi:molybdopterin molybdotransferase
MLTPHEAQEVILRTVHTLQSEMVSHEHAAGRTLAQDIISTVELPPFDNSAMDGYAVRAADVDGASQASPVVLQVLETTAAGAAPEYSVEAGTCSKIMTGAPLPAGADAVIMREDTRGTKDGQVAILTTARTGQHIRRAGSDVARGEVVLRAGSVVRAAEWGMLASLGCAHIEAHRQPRVAVLITGDELVAVDAELKPGQIRDSNSFTLRGLVENCGAIVSQYRHMPDDAAALQDALRSCAAHCDAIVTSGGVSMGDFDPVRDVLHDTAHVHFWKVSMKPGKPVLFATLQDNEYSVPVFGLPGNPVSVMVSFEQFVRPALLQMQGRRARRRVTLPVRLQSALNSPAGRTEFARALVVPDADEPNSWRAILPGDQGSGRLSTMTQANALLHVPADVTHVEAGSFLQAQMTDWPEIAAE